jgi:hypothetical protein
MSKEKAVKLVPFILGLAGFGLICLGLLRHPGVWKEAFVSIGQALLGTGIVGYFIDRVARKEFIKGVAHEALGYILGRNLPFALKRHIDAIINTTYVREMYRQVYTLSRIDEAHVRLAIETSFVVRNYAAVPVPYLTGLEVYEHEQPKFIQLTCYSQHNDEKCYVLSGTELEVKSDRVGVRRAEGKQVNLQAAEKENSAYNFV